MRRNLAHERQASLHLIVTEYLWELQIPGRADAAAGKIIHTATYSRASEAGKGEPAKQWRLAMGSVIEAAKAILTQGVSNARYDALLAALPQ